MEKQQEKTLIEHELGSHVFTYNEAGTCFGIKGQHIFKEGELCTISG